MKHDLTNVYKFYLLAAIEIKDKNSKIEKYRKVWKALQTKWKLEGFNKGPEVEMEVGEQLSTQVLQSFVSRNFQMPLK